MARAPFWPGFGRFLRYRKDLGQFATALGGGDGEEFIICAASPAQSEVARSKNALQMRKQHLDLLSLLHRDTVLLGLGAVTSHLAGVFIFWAILHASSFGQPSLSTGKPNSGPVL